ncbi:NADP-dependent malic enzyme-like isoform X1 [Daktulosphaira vitifoliae]|uniref:NADP-dependent malic enzyme-like isoform X1 n=2 Tax=Daktulosphaira vitifoliae TaxID=58002 RepID=UPI0021AAB6DA|nr:NADP-dependent malic enzyme-like isoform X1 [Daktulosphaira vitifoliae]
MTSFDRLGQFPHGSSVPISPAMVSGLDHLRDGRLNKGLAFTIEERQSLGILGLLPPCVKTQDEQVEQALANIARYSDDLNKYIYLMGLQERNEKLFYRLMAENVEAFMPLVYTPTVGLACQKYGLIFQKPRGLFISIHDAGHVYDVLKNWPEQDVRAIVVTDGERILGLGDLGVNGMGIPVGKLALYTALAGIKPHQCLPVTLDCGTNTQTLLNDPHYIGSKQKRVTGKDYDDFIDEFMQAAVKRYGQNCLIQFEDFANSNAFRFLDKYRKSYCTFNDDIQGTASVALAGLFASLRITRTRLSDNVILFQGAGEAALGIAELCVMAMLKEGTTLEEARSKIWLFDSKGLVVKDRPEGGVTGHKIEYAKNVSPIKVLSEAIRKVKPTVLIGAAAIGGVFNKEIIQEISSYNSHPVIFALSNPTSKAECTAEQAYTYSNGKAVFASGSPFNPVTYKSKTYYPGQGNNSYIFPGVALGVICAGVRTITDEVFIIAAQTLAALVTEEDLDNGSLYPPLQSIKECSLKIAVKVMEYAYATGVASTYPEPEDKIEFIKSQLYNYNYSSSIPPIYSYPSHL